MAKSMMPTKELAGWNNTGFDDKGWMQPQVLPATGAKLTAQMNEPIKIMQTVTPVNVKQLKPGCVHYGYGPEHGGTP